MPKLVVDRLRCIQDTPEWTPDEIYLVVACASPGARGELRVLTFAAPDWHGLTEGAERDADVTIDSAWHADKIYVGLLLEQEGKRDLAADEVRARLEQELGEVVQMFASVRGARPAEVAEQLCREVDRCVGSLPGNDEPVGGAAILRLDPGAGGASFTFHSPKSRYRLDLKLV